MSNKKDNTPIIEETDYEINRDDLAINSKVKEFIEKAGQVYKWMNETGYKKRQGRHKNGYVAFQAPESLRKDLGNFGCSPEGYIRFGDLLLGVKSKQGVELHQKRLTQSTIAQLEGVKGAAKQRNAEAKAAGIKITDEDF